MLPLSWLAAIVADKRSTVEPRKEDGVEGTSQSAPCPLLNGRWKLESKCTSWYQQSPTVNMYVQLGLRKKLWIGPSPGQCFLGSLNFKLGMRREEGINALLTSFGPLSISLPSPIFEVTEQEPQPGGAGAHKSATGRGFWQTLFGLDWREGSDTRHPLPKIGNGLALDPKSG